MGLLVKFSIAVDEIDNSLTVCGDRRARNTKYDPSSDEHRMKDGVGVHTQKNDDLVITGYADWDDLGHSRRDEALQMTDQAVVVL